MFLENYPASRFAVALALKDTRGRAHPALTGAACARTAKQAARAKRCRARSAASSPQWPVLGMVTFLGFGFHAVYRRPKLHSPVARVSSKPMSYVKRIYIYIYIYMYGCVFLRGLRFSVWGVLKGNPKRTPFWGFRQTISLTLSDSGGNRV